MEYSPSKYLSKKGWLDYLYYKVGNQNFNFWVCGTYKKNGHPEFTKWKRYLNCVSTVDELNKTEDWKQKGFFNSINQRQIFPNEIVLDIEEPERIEEVVERIKEWGWDGEDVRVYETGSRGFHIHLIFNRSMSVIEKEAVVKKLGTDIQKCSEKNLIALEYFPHWKTGKLKREVEI